MKMEGKICIKLVELMAKLCHGLKMNELPIHASTCFPVSGRNIQVSQQKKNICDDELHSSQSC